MDTPIPSAEERRAARKRWEEAKIANARREVAAGHFITGEELDRWLEQSLATDDPVPIPPTVAARQKS